MRRFIKISRIVYLILSVIGGIMTFLNSAIAAFPQTVFNLTANQIQYYGLVILVVVVILNMITSLLEDFRKDASEPVLSLNNLRTNDKPVFLNTAKHVKGKYVHSSTKLADFDFAYVDVINNPKIRNSTASTAERAHAEIVFIGNDGSIKKIDHGRWCDQDTPLLCGDNVDVKSLKIVDINPGNPISLAMAFKKKGKKDVYAYYFTDHKRFNSAEEINKVCKERALGKPPIKVIIKIDGKFEPKEFHRILDIDNNGEFSLRETKRIKIATHR